MNQALKESNLQYKAIEDKIGKKAMKELYVLLDDLTSLFLHEVQRTPFHNFRNRCGLKMKRVEYFNNMGFQASNRLSAKENDCFL